MQARLATALQNRRGGALSPQTLFGAAACQTDAPIDRVMLVVGHDEQRTLIEPADPRQMVDSLAAVLECEESGLRDYCRRRRFLFPGTTIESLERASDLRRRRLAQMLVNKETHIVRHPLPAKIADLQEALSSCLNGRNVSDKRHRSRQDLRPLFDGSPSPFLPSASSDDELEVCARASS